MVSTKPVFTYLSFDSSSRSSTDHTHAIVELLEQCFPGVFEGRSFYKQQPHSRILAFNDDQLIAHVALDRRVVNVGGRLLKITGIIDLCVTEPFRGRGIGSDLLQRVEESSQDRDFIILYADKPNLYASAGFTTLENAMTRWLAIDKLESVGVVERELSDCFMYKTINEKTWPSGKIDLLGYLF